MRSHGKELWFAVRTRRALLNTTPEEIFHGTFDGKREMRVRLEIIGELPRLGPAEGFSPRGGDPRVGRLPVWLRTIP